MENSDTQEPTKVESKTQFPFNGEQKEAASPSELEENMPSENESSESEHETLRRELEAKTEENHNLNEKYLRLAAEFENYKRRAQRDQNDAIRFANEKFFKDCLPTLDNLERAIQCGREQPVNGAMLEGVELTYKQFMDTLTKCGVRQISSIGEPFDPACHQAVAQVESDSTPPNSVVQEFQKGYFLHERILRPAMVTVAKNNQDNSIQTTTEKNGVEGGIKDNE